MGGLYSDTRVLMGSFRVGLCVPFALLWSDGKELCSHVLPQARSGVSWPVAPSKFSPNKADLAVVATLAATRK